jgi:hypothetical protein
MRLKARAEESTCRAHMHWVARQKKLELPNDEEEVNTRDILKAPYNVTAGLVDTCGDHGCVFIRRHD